LKAGIIVEFPTVDESEESMATHTVKEQVLQAVGELPDDTTFEEAMERIYFLYKVERGLAQADAGDVVEHDDVLREFASWRE
jgi:predicted transcriptional regulator